MAGERVEQPSFCRICNAMCGILVTVERDRVVRVRGDAQHPLSEGYTCPKGRALPSFHHDPRRLDQPTIDGGQVGWGVMLDDLAERVRRTVDHVGADGIAMYLASGSAFDSAGRRAAERFLRVIGSQQKYTATTIDTPSKPLVAELVGGWSGLTPIWDHERSTLLVLIGSNPVVSHGHSNAMPSPHRLLRGHRSRGGEVWVIDPRRTETARAADHHLAPRPGTDWLVLAHLVRALLPERGSREDAALHARASGVDRLRDALQPLSPGVTSGGSGIPREDLDALVAAVRRHGRVSALTGTGVSMSSTANVAEWLLWALHVVTDSYDQPGGMWFNPGYLLQLDTRTLPVSDGTPGAGPPSRPELPRRFDEWPCAALLSEIEAGDVTTLFVVGGNPVTAFPDAKRTRAAFASLETLAVVDVLPTETTELATHLLPAVGALERADLPLLLDGYQLAVATQFTPAIVPPVAGRWPIWRMFGALGERLGLDVLGRGQTTATATDESLLLPVAERSRGGADAVFAARRGVVDSGAVFGWVRGRLPDGRWRLAPAVLVAQLAQASSEAPEQLQLIAHRQLETMNSQLRDLTDTAVMVAPSRAAELGGDGTEVEVRVAGRVVTGIVRGDDRIPHDVVAIPHGWSTPNVSDLTSADDDVDPLTGMVRQSALAAEIRRVG
ncbi:MAG TPA: molybdopterin-dependent oxidoreductase [Frankiaceae bacterium]|nr:molybdopterin-dependent oxidoreductase [Frankiaceae bacterium]